MSRAFLILLTLAACSKRNTDNTTPTGPTGTGTDTSTGTGTGTSTTTGTGTQTPPPYNSEADCPAIQVKAPDSVSQGTKARVAATLVGGTGTPTYKWAVSSGSIASGQGTTTITVDTSGLSGSSVTATLQIGGVPTQCATTTASATFLVGP
jgi:hypothetical protein